MKTRLVAFVLALAWTPVLFAQQMPMMTVPKLGKLVAGDTLNVTIFKKQDQRLDPAINVSLTIGVREDGTIAVPLLLDKVPAAGLTMSQLNSDLEQRYTWYFSHFGPSAAFTPPRVAVGFLGHHGGTPLDSLIAKIGKLPPAGNAPR